MIHARKDYNRIQDPAGLIPEDEPVFLLRGQDEYAPELLKKYAEMHRKRGDMVIADLTEMQMDKMLDWQRNRKSKIADLPNAAVSS